MPEPSPPGLDPATAAARLLAEGPNQIGPRERRKLGAIALEVAREPMFVLLLASGSIYLAMGDPHEAAALLGFVLIIMTITVMQERRTDNTLDALGDLSSPRARVMRGGELLRIAGQELVRGDLLVLAEGDRVAADGEVLQAHELAVDESLQTGESEPVAKLVGSKVQAGTLAVRGQGLVRVTATGPHTALGRMGRALLDIKVEPSPLRSEVGRLTRRLTVVGVLLSLLLAGLFWLLRGDGLAAILAGITLAMGLLPQELAVIMIVFFALGARRLAARQVLTRRLNAIETLGATTVLCVDKTGTLTQNRMALAALWVDDQTWEAGPLPEAFHALVAYAVLASEIEPHDPMERALHDFAAVHLRGSEHLHPDWSLAREYELSTELLVMSHGWQQAESDHHLVAAKGAPEAVAALCHLTGLQQASVVAHAAQLAGQGLRVLGVAKASHHGSQAWPEQQTAFAFEFVGLLGLADPLRPEVPTAVAQCHRAGIRVVMITGDHARTALAVARQAGIPSQQILSCADVQLLPEADLARLLQPVSLDHGSPGEAVNVFARVTPSQKLKLVQAFKSAGEVVAMTGDGVNDAPALKAAHIGIAMGQRGTDVAREAASLVLLKDDFTAILAAIELGRRIYANLRQAAAYTLAVHVPIVGVTLLPMLFGLPLVLAPLHIAFVELVIDPACSIVFEAEQSAAGNTALMTQPPRTRAEPLLASDQVLQALLHGALITLLVTGLYAGMLASGSDVGSARAASFVALVTANAALIFPNRCRHGAWRQLFTDLSATPLWVLAATAAGLLTVTWVPAFAKALGFTLLPGLTWLAAFAAGLALLPLFQLTKKKAPTPEASRL